MSEKQKLPKKDNGTDPNFDAPSDQDLEKKIDRMLSVEEPDTPVESPKPSAQEPKESPKPSAPEPKKIKIADTPEPKPEVTEPVSAPEQVDAPEPTPAPVEAPVDPLVAISGAPVLPVNKTSAFKKKISITDGNEPAVEEKPTLPADNEIEPFEEAEEIEEIVLGETEAAPEPEPTPEPIKPVSQLPEPDALGLDSASTSRAVDEIIAAEADELLIARDQTYAEKQAEAAANVAARSEKVKKPKKNRKLKKIFFKIFLLLILVGAAVIGAVPAYRYAVLNAAGVRVSSSVSVFDETNGQPLKNAEFTINGSSSKTDAEGNASIGNLKLGKAKMSVKKPAYAEQTQDLTLGWGSNPLGDIKLKAVGSQYTVVVTDFLSDKPVTKAEAAAGDVNARSNDNGKLVIAVPQTDSDNLELEISAEGYRTEKVKIDLSNKEEKKVKLVPSRKHAFISKRNGSFDLYKIDVDGSNEQKVLSGTGQERSEAMSLAIHPTKNLAALVSNREPAAGGKESPSTLSLINLEDNSIIQATQSPRIQLIDWIGDKLIYVKVGENETEDSTKRHRLVSYDINSKSERELASTNYFNDVMTANGAIYYAPASHQVNGAVGLYKINPDGNYRKSVFDKEVWNLLRPNHDKLSVSIGQEWFDLALNNDAMTKASGAPATLKSITYVDGPTGKTSLWTEDRDGKGTLLGYDNETKTDAVIHTQSGIKSPLRWIDSTHIVYRVSSTSEIADYVISTEGGAPKKIRDVTDTAGIDKWYYY